jgi:hypothetical protein
MNSSKYRYWYWSLGSDGNNGLYGDWGKEPTYTSYTSTYIKYPSVPVEKCFNRNSWTTVDKFNCMSGDAMAVAAYRAHGWSNDRYNANNWDVLCEWRAPVNAARDFKLPDTTDCFEFEDAAQENVRFFSCPWIKSDLAYITEKCESIGLSLASVRSDAELKNNNPPSNTKTLCLRSFRIVH